MKKRTVLALDIGGTNSRAACVDETGDILSCIKIPTPRTENASDIIGSLLSALRSDDLSRFSPEAVGVSVAGPVDQESGVLLHPPNMVYDAVPIRVPLQKELGLPVLLMNDCRAAVLGEVWKGAGAGFSHVVYITISTGLGGGVFSNGRLLTGKGGNAGEIGHMPIDNKYNLLCPCGHYGHWEGIASGGALPRFFREWCRSEDLHPGTFPTSAAELLNRSEEQIVQRFLDELSSINARGISAVIVAYDPDLIIFDGPLAQQHQDLIITPACRQIDAYLSPPRFLLSRLSGHAPLLGAAAAALGISEFR